MSDTEKADMAHPHDLLVRNILSDTDLAADLFRNYLPPEWGTVLEWDSLRREDGDTVASDLSKLTGDLRYSARFKGSGGELEVFLFLEHQSRADPFMTLRMVGYVYAAYQQRRPALEKGGRFPYPLAVVLYHGKKPWKKITPMRDLIATPPGVTGDILNLPICLIDLATIPVGRLRGHPMVCTLLDSLQAASTGALSTRLDSIVGRLRGLGGEKRIKPWTDALATYYYSVIPGEPRDTTDALVRAFGGLHSKREASNMVMTAAEHLHQEGRAEGRAAGRAEGKIESVISILEIRFSEIPAALRKKLLKMRDEDRIATILKHAATCQSLKEFQKAL